jgi:phosphoglycolate phosphatase-like HAD superfamily hydrolase
MRNILWDVDGTLFDTYPAITYAISQALNGLGESVALNVVDRLARQSIEYCLATLAQRFRLDQALLRGRYLASYERLPLANQPPFLGVAEVCAAVQAPGGQNVAVTHRAVRSTAALLDAHGLAPLFAGIVSVEQGYPRKPDPAIVLAALAIYALDPAETWMVGDRALDIQAGRAAGLRTCLFGRASLAQPADLQIDQYSDLLRLLEADEPEGAYAQAAPGPPLAGAGG